MNSMLELVKHRYTAKRYDVNKPISDETLNDLLEVLRLSPSSVNIQPWHFYALKTKEALHAIRPAVKDFNLERTEHAPVIIVFAIEKHLDDAYVHRLMAQEAADGRFRGQFADPEFAAKLEASAAQASRPIAPARTAVNAGPPTSAILRSVSCSWQLPAWALTPRHWAACISRRLTKFSDLPPRDRNR